MKRAKIKDASVIRWRKRRKKREEWKKTHALLCELFASKEMGIALFGPEYGLLWEQSKLEPLDLTRDHHILKTIKGEKVEGT